MDYNNATAQECADWLAVNDGWAWRPWAGEEIHRLWTHPNGDEELEYRGTERLDNEHGPYKLTLDGAAAALPSNWRVDYIRDRGEYAGLGNARWYVRAFRVPGDITNCVSCDGTDELTARYRAAVASRMEGGKA